MVMMPSKLNYPILEYIKLTSEKNFSTLQVFIREYTETSAFSSDNINHEYQTSRENKEKRRKETRWEW